MNQIETKKDFIAVCQFFAKHGGAAVDVQASAGEQMLMGAIADYFSGDEAIAETEYGVRWTAYLHKYLVDTFEAFRTLDTWQTLRVDYKRATDREIPDLIDIRGGFAHAGVTRDLAYTFTKLLKEPWLETQLRSHFDAEMHVLNATFQTFVRRCYRPDLAMSIKTGRCAGNSGRFGRTDLMSFVMGGRVMMTFTREPEMQSDDSISNALYVAAKKMGKFSDGRLFAPRPEMSVTFVGSADDLSGKCFGLNYPTCKLTDALAMIEEVTEAWPRDKARFAADPDVRLG